MNEKQEPPVPIRYACIYTPDCDREATTTVVINGHPKAVCDRCYHIEIRRQNTERERRSRPVNDTTNLSGFGCPWL